MRQLIIQPLLTLIRREEKCKIFPDSLNEHPALHSLHHRIIGQDNHFETSDNQVFADFDQKGGKICTFGLVVGICYLFLHV